MPSNPMIPTIVARPPVSGVGSDRGVAPLRIPWVGMRRQANCRTWPLIPRLRQTFPPTRFSSVSFSGKIAASRQTIRPDANGTAAGDEDVSPQSSDDRRRRHRRIDVGGCRRTGIPDQADHADRAMAGRRIDRHLHARDRRKRLEGAGPADRDRQQGRRRRHGRPGHHGGRSEAGRLHHRADPDHRIPPAPDAGSVVGSGQGFHLYRPSHRLHLWCDDQRRGTVQDLAGRDRFRQEESRQGDLRDAGDRHLAAYRHGANCGDGRHQADAGAVQGRRRNQRRGAWPAHDAAGRFRPDGGRWSMPENCGC